jgi:hypothetical protein
LVIAGNILLLVIGGSLCCYAWDMMVIVMVIFGVVDLA